MLRFEVQNSDRALKWVIQFVEIWQLGPTPPYVHFAFT